MKKSILAIGVASAMFAGTAFACPNCYTPVNTSSFSGTGGAGVVSSASVSSTAVGGTSTGSGYQSSGAFATNTTAATASSIPTSAGAGNAINLSASTSSVGNTWSYAGGNSAGGTSSALAGQGGIAKAKAKGVVCDSSWSRRPGAGADATANGHGNVHSTVGVASGSKSYNSGVGASDQQSGAGAWNKTTAGVRVDAFTTAKPKAGVKLSGKVNTEGESWAYGNDNGAGFAGGIAGQSGNGSVKAYGKESARRGTPGGRNVQNGHAKLELGASTSSYDAALGHGNVDSAMDTVSGASAKGSAKEVGKIGSHGAKETTTVQVDTGAYSDHSGYGDSYGGATSDANGSALGKGSMHGLTKVRSNCRNCR